MYNKGEAVPTVLKVGKFKVYIYYQDHLPPHIHVQGPESELKFLIQNMDCIYAYNISLKDINKLQKYLKQFEFYFMEKWDEFQSKK